MKPGLRPRLRPRRFGLFISLLPLLALLSLLAHAAVADSRLSLYGGGNGNLRQLTNLWQGEVALAFPLPHVDEKTWWGQCHLSATRGEFGPLVAKSSKKSLFSLGLGLAYHSSLLPQALGSDSFEKTSLSLAYHRFSEKNILGEIAQGLGLKMAYGLFWPLSAPLSFSPGAHMGFTVNYHLAIMRKTASLLGFESEFESESEFEEEQPLSWTSLGMEVIFPF